MTDHGTGVSRRFSVQRVMAGALAVLLLSGVARAGESEEERPCHEGLPEGNLFAPLIADPKTPRFSASYLSADTEMRGRVTVGSVALGHNLGLFRWNGKQSGDGWQINLFGVVLSQFDMDTRSEELVNSDYVVGFPLEYRRGAFSFRLTVFHQSSHLGDELLLGPDPPERINLSVQVLELLLAGGPWKGVRVYGGGKYLLSRTPSDLERQVAQAGVEYWGPRVRFLGGRFLGGLDVKWLEERDWGPGVSFKAGFEFGDRLPSRHRFRLMGEYYNGFTPFGQFLNRHIRYVGAGIYFLL